MLNSGFELVEGLQSEEWDGYLASMNGHPLQSALWGDARKIINGIQDERWMLQKNDKPVALVRFERRGVGPFKKVAWVPQGPTIAPNTSYEEVVKKIHLELKKKGMMVSVFNPWCGKEFEVSNLSRKTVWLDLTIPLKKICENLDKQWRYGVRYAERSGVFTEVTKKYEDVAEFYELCQKVSARKNFDLRASLDFFMFLLKEDYSKNVGGKLFLAKYKEKLCAGAFVLYSGSSLHYMWGAVDREFSKLRAGELVQWAVIEWAYDHAFKLYDLEGIDEKNNPGVAAFKKKMGGQVIELMDRQVYPLTYFGKVFSRVIG